MALIPYLIIGGIIAATQANAVSNLIDQMKISLSVWKVDLFNVSPGIVFLVTIVNPSTGSITIKSISGDLSWGGNIIADIYTTDEFSIAALSTTDFKLNVKLNLLTGAAAVFNAIKKKGNEEGFQITLKFNTNVGVATYKQSFKITI